MVFMRALNTRSRGLLLVTILTASAVAFNLNQTNGRNVMAIQTTNAQTISEAHAKPNPLLARWEGPYGGVPPFDRVQVAQFKPALEAGMAENLADVDRIAKDPAAPTFDEALMKKRGFSATDSKSGTGQ
jgi:peptidyl-dipeptidase Dcp